MPGLSRCCWHVACTCRKSSIGGRMDSGLYSAYSGLKVNSDILELLSNNLANVNTTGFKGDEAFLRIFNHAVSDNDISLNRVLNDSSFVEGAHIDLTAGTLKPTGRDL